MVVDGYLVGEVQNIDINFQLISYYKIKIIKPKFEKNEQLSFL